MADIIVRNDDDQAVRRRHRDQGDGSFAEVVTLPDELITGSQGRAQRLRVDPGQTGFFDGREFRTFKEFDVATTAVYVVKIVIPPGINVILWEFMFQLDAGSVRVETMVPGGDVTEGGSFSEALPRLPTNTMTERPTPIHTVQTTLNAGGTLTGGSVSGGTIIDVSRIKAADNSNFAASVGGEGGAERGVQPGTYYWRFNLAAALGVFKARWEERPIT